MLGGGHKTQGQKFDSWPPKPNPIHKNKSLCLKDHHVYVKKKAGHSNITFWIFIPFWALRADLEKGHRKKHMPSILVFGFDQAYLWPKLWLDTHSHSLHTPIHPSDILQTPSRHHSATLEKCWDGALVEKTVDLYNSLFVVGITCRRVDSTRQSRDTLQTLPDTIQTTFKTSQKILEWSLWENTAEDKCNFLAWLWPRLDKTQIVTQNTLPDTIQT